MVALARPLRRRHAILSRSVLLNRVRRCGCREAFVGEGGDDRRLSARWSVRPELDRNESMVDRVVGGRDSAAEDGNQLEFDVEVTRNLRADRRLVRRNANELDRKPEGALLRIDVRATDLNESSAVWALRLVTVLCLLAFEALFETNAGFHVNDGKLESIVHPRRRDELGMTTVDVDRFRFVRPLSRVRRLELRWDDEVAVRQGTSILRMVKMSAPNLGIHLAVLLHLIELIPVLTPILNV